MERKQRKGQKVLMFPQVWDELTEKDWRSVLQLRDRLERERKYVSVEDVRRETVRLLLSNRGLAARPNDRQYLVLVYQLAEGLDWLWEYRDDALQLVYRSTNQLLPRWKYLLGPMSHGADLQWGEYKAAVELCSAFTESGNEDTLQLLAGLLYRRRRKDNKLGRERDDFDSDGYKDWSERGRQLPRWARWGIYAWFCFFCEYLQTGVFIINHNEVSFGSIFNSPGGSSEKAQKDNLGLDAISIAMAESGVFGTLDDVEHAPLLKIMMKLLKDKQQVDALKKQ